MAGERPLVAPAPAAGDRRRWQRGDLAAVVARHELTWEGGFGLLAVVYITLGVLIDTEHQTTVSEALVFVLATVFLLEFLVRIVDSRSRLDYLREHWVDLVSAIPLVGGLRAIRLLRVLRALAVTRVFRTAAHQADAHDRARNAFWFLGPMLFCAWVLTAGLYYGFEHGANTRVHDFGDALYWSFLTATTVGYGDVTPVTSEGRVLAGFVVFMGIGLVGYVSARLTASFVRHRDPAYEALHGRMDGLEAQMGELRTLLHGLHIHLGTEHGRRLATKSEAEEGVKET